MKKSLFLLPLLAAFALCGCGDNGGGGGSGGGGGGGGGGGDDPAPVGEKIGSVKLYNQTDCEDKEADPLVYSNGKCSVMIEQGEAKQSLAEAVAASKTYEMRVYAHMMLTFSCDVEFSSLDVKFSTYAQKDGTTYYFDFDDAEGMESNDVDESKGIAHVTLEEAAKEWSIDNWHQTRIDSVTFYA